MAKAFLDSSVLIGLVFRHAGERAACAKVLPEDGGVCSRYVIFEVARGFLRSMILLYNKSFEFDRFSDLHQFAYSQENRWKPYRMATWLGAMTDFHAELEVEDGLIAEGQKLELFRAKLRGWIRRGWAKIQNDFEITNDAGCRNDLPAPFMLPNQRIDQSLPITQCGEPASCALQEFVKSHALRMVSLATHLESLPAKQKDDETLHRIIALRHIAGTAHGSSFEGKKCHACGDALICLEVHAGHDVATKNTKHFEPIAAFLGIPLLFATTAKTTGSGNVGSKESL
jgi:predicted nucleic acid-binding protein